MILNTVGGATSGGGDSSYLLSFEKGAVYMSANDISAESDYDAVDGETIYTSSVSVGWNNSSMQYYMYQNSYVVSITANGSVGSAQIAQVLTYPHSIVGNRTDYMPQPLFGIFILGNGTVINTISNSDTTPYGYACYCQRSSSYDELIASYYAASQSEAETNGFSTSTSYSIEIYLPTQNENMSEVIS